MNKIKQGSIVRLAQDYQSHQDIVPEGREDNYFGVVKYINSETGAVQLNNDLNGMLCYHQDDLIDVALMIFGSGKSAILTTVSINKKAVPLSNLVGKCSADDLNMLINENLIELCQPANVGSNYEKDHVRFKHSQYC